jgi:hypothetical protein
MISNTGGGHAAAPLDTTVDLWESPLFSPANGDLRRCASDVAQGSRGILLVRRARVSRSLRLNHGGLNLTKSFTAMLRVFSAGRIKCY